MVQLTRSLTALALCAILALIPGGISRAAGKPTPTSLPLPANDYSMGRAPQNCPSAETDLLHVGHDNRPNVFAHTFWWVGRGPLLGHSGWQVSQGRVFLTFGVRTRYGYPQKVGWQLTRPASVPITLDGWNLRTHQPIWFGHPVPVSNPQPLVPPPVIAWPAGIVRFQRAPTLIFVPAAGCYVLRVRWRTGGWSLPFAVGCVADRRMFGVAHCR